MSLSHPFVTLQDLSCHPAPYKKTATEKMGLLLSLCMSELSLNILPLSQYICKQGRRGGRNCETAEKVAERGRRRDTSCSCEAYQNDPSITDLRLKSAPVIDMTDWSVDELAKHIFFNFCFYLLKIILKHIFFATWNCHLI